MIGKGVRAAIVTAIMATFIAVGFVSDATAQTPVNVRWENNAGTGETVRQFAALNPCIVSIFRWEPDGQHWTRWYNGVPDYVNDFNSLTFLNVHYGYWFAFDADCLAGD